MAVVLEVHKPGDTQDLLNVYLTSSEVIKGFQFNVSGITFDRRQPINHSADGFHISTGMGGLIFGYLVGKDPVLEPRPPIAASINPTKQIIYPRSFPKKIRLASFNLSDVKSSKYPFCIHSSIFVNEIDEVLHNVVEKCYKSEISDPEPISLAGDVNLDGEVNVTDIVNIVNHILEIDTLAGQPFKNADLNVDGRVDVVDIVSVVNIILNNSRTTMTSKEVDELVNDVIKRVAKENLIKPSGGK